MADPFSIASGALQVAGAGFQLAKTLYNCAKTIKDAETDLEGIANEVNLVAKVLINFGNILDEDEASDVCSSNLHTDAQAALDGCKRAFDALDAALKSITKPKASGQISRLSKWKWPLEKGRTKTLQATLERLKTTLSLMLEMLGYAKRKARSRPNEDIDLDKDRMRVERLIATNENLVRQITTNNPSPNSTQVNSMLASSQPMRTAESRVLPDPVLDDAKETDLGKRRTTLLNADSSIPTKTDHPSPIGIRLDGAGPSSPQNSNGLVLPAEAGKSPVTAKDLKTTKADDSDIWDLPLKLQECSDTVLKLSSSLEAAIMKWNQCGTYDPHAIVANFRLVRQSYERLLYLPIPGPNDSRNFSPNVREETNCGGRCTDREGLRQHEAPSWTMQPIPNTQRHSARSFASTVTGESAPSPTGWPFEWQLDPVFRTAPSKRHLRNEGAGTCEQSERFREVLGAKQLLFEVKQSSPVTPMDASNQRSPLFSQPSLPPAPSHGPTPPAHAPSRSWTLERHSRSRILPEGPSGPDEYFPAGSHLAGEELNEEDLFRHVEEAIGPIQIEARSPKIAVSQFGGNNAESDQDRNELEPTGMDTKDVHGWHPHQGPPPQAPDSPELGHPFRWPSGTSETSVDLENTDEAEAAGQLDLKAQGADEPSNFSGTGQLSEEILLAGGDAFGASGEDFDGGELHDPSHRIEDAGVKAEDAFNLLLRRWTTLAA